MKSVHASCIGDAHVKSKKPKQDDAFSFPNGDPEAEQKPYAIGIVADGHGSPRYFRSHIGADIATKVVFEVLEHVANAYPLFENITNHQAFIKNIKVTILAKWAKAVRGHLADQPVTEHDFKRVIKENAIKGDVNKKTDKTGTAERVKKLKADHEKNPYKTYGTTLLATLLTQHYHLSIQLGDGMIIMSDPSYTENRILHQNDLQHEGPHGLTDSLCTTDAYDHMYATFEPCENDQRIGFFLCTDGVSEAFDRNESLYANIKNITKAYLSMAHTEAVEAITEWIQHVSSRSLAKDDASLALLLNHEAF